MNLNAINLAGQRFERLLVESRAPNEGRYVAWNCRCDCGNTLVVITASLRSGNTKSCNCLQREWAVKHNSNREHLPNSGCFQPTHGATNTPEFRAWSSMKNRCYNRKVTSYPDYGGRGITVCNEWLHDFPAFLAHIGPRPSARLSIDRINNDGNYEPNNVRWATKRQQTANRRPNRGWGKARNSTPG